MKSAQGLLAWSIAGTALAYYLVSGPLQPVPHWSSPIFWYLLKVLDPVADALLLLIALSAFALRKRQPWQRVIALFAEQPAAVAMVLFLLLCAGSIHVYRAQPLSMDEYSALFQAKAFAAGKLAGVFPPELLNRLVPPGFQNIFLTVSSSSGEVSSTYWPVFALMLVPFTWLDVPWAANPAIGALSVLAIHRLTREITASREAGGWAVLFTLASPAFIVNCISFYAMPAHLLFNVLYALLLLRPTAARAAAAGLIGSLALCLHNPLPHLLFALPFIGWLAARRESLPPLVCLLASYGVLGASIGLGWKLYLASMGSVAGTAAAGSAAGTGPLGLVLDNLSIFVLPTMATLAQRIAGLSKLWSWAAFGLVVLAAWGFWSGRDRTPVRLLGAAFAATMLGYLAVPLDQGHGWGYRYLHSAWFVLPAFAAIAVTGVGNEHSASSSADVRGMAAWGIVLSLLLCNGLRLYQVEGFVARHLAQVPPLARPLVTTRSEIVFVNPRNGFYSIDLIQNDPLLRGPRMIMQMDLGEDLEPLMTARFPGYVRAAAGPWGEQWTRASRR